MEQTTQQFGIVTLCADKRFHQLVEEKFQELTGLSATQYWIQATAGGTPAIPNTVTSDYAYHHGARHMGWAAHGDSCGGYPDVPTQEMEEKLDAVIAEMKQKYPDATHYKIFSTNEKTVGTKV